MLNRDSNIHVIGASSTEMSAVYIYLLSKGHRRLTLHDFSKNFPESLRTSHRFYPETAVGRYMKATEKAAAFHQWDSYLKTIEEADAIFAPQSWFIYPENRILHGMKKRLLYFTDLCFDLFKGRVIGVTGTVGKSTTALYASILTGALLSGNDRENILDLSVIEGAGSDAVLVFEVSNRHLKNGLKGRMDIGILTNICPNHIPDHGSLEGYRQVKNGIFGLSGQSVYNGYNPYPGLAIEPADPDNSYSFSLAAGSDACIDGDSVILLGEELCKIKSLPLDFNHEVEDFLAASLAARLMGIDSQKIRDRIPLLRKKLHFRSAQYQANGIRIINDGASCLPENTRRITENIQEDFILITGGSRQAPLADEFDGMAASLSKNRHAKGVIAIGPMAGMIIAALKRHGICNARRHESLDSAVEHAAESGVRCIVFSPGCGPGDEFRDKYERGRAFDICVKKNVSNKQAAL